MTKIIAIGRKTKNVLTSSDPNDFIFHSNYNTFKIIKTDVVSVVIPANATSQQFAYPHLLNFIPLVDAFAQVPGTTRAFKPNSQDIDFYSPKAGFFTSGITFEAIEADSTNIYFTFSNSNGTPTTVNVRYYCLEEI